MRTETVKMGKILAQKSESVLESTVELFCVERLSIFAVEFHVLTEDFGLTIRTCK